MSCISYFCNLTTTDYEVYLLYNQHPRLAGVLSEQGDIELVLKEVLKRSSNGWDYVTEGLIKLAFILLDTAGPEASVGVFLIGKTWV